MKKDIILSPKSWEGKIKLELTLPNCEEFYLRFNENIYKQIFLLKNISNLGMNIFIQTYSFYQDNVGAMQLPIWYNGRIISTKRLDSIVLEFKYDERMLERKNSNFIYTLFLSSRIYITHLSAQEIQEYYYEYSEEKLEKFLKSFIAVIDIDNDGSYMKFISDKKYDLKKYTTKVLKE